MYIAGRPPSFQKYPKDDQTDADTITDKKKNPIFLPTVPTVSKPIGKENEKRPCENSIFPTGTQFLSLF